MPLDLAPGDYIDRELALSRHGRCGDLVMIHDENATHGAAGVRCQLQALHDGPHADVSLSGLVLATWPNVSDEEDHL